MYESVHIGLHVDWEADDSRAIRWWLCGIASERIF
jgi:hypothetical protein